MTKQEFLETLRAALSGRVGAGQVNENINYYEEYINSQTRQGRSEEEVLGELGDPRLLARTIAEAGKHAGVSEPEYAETPEDKGYGGFGGGQFGARRMPAWLVLLLAAAVCIGVLALVVMFVWWLAPVILFVWLIMLAVRLLRGRR